LFPGSGEPDELLPGGVGGGGCEYFKNDFERTSEILHDSFVADSDNLKHFSGR